MLHDVGSTLTFFSGGSQCDDDAWLVGDGRGDWTIKFTRNGDALGTVSSSEVPDGPRKIVWRTRGLANFCGGDVTVELLAGSDAKIDAFGSH